MADTRRASSLVFMNRILDLFRSSSSSPTANPTLTVIPTLGWGFGSGNRNDRSILPFLPRSVRIVLLIVLLLNWGSLPGVWHLRVFSSVIVIRLRQFLGLHFLIHARRRAFVSAFSPILENPFALCVTYTSTVTFADSDFYGHLSNSSSARVLDYARMKAALVCFPSVLEAKAWMGLGWGMWCWVKELKLGESFEVRISVGGWDEKWLYLVVQYVTYPEGKGKEKYIIDKEDDRDEEESQDGGALFSPLAYRPPTSHLHARPSSPFASTISRRATSVPTLTRSSVASAGHSYFPSPFTPKHVDSTSDRRTRSASFFPSSSPSARSPYASAAEETEEEEEEEESGPSSNSGLSSGSSTAVSTPPSSLASPLTMKSPTGLPFVTPSSPSPISTSPPSSTTTTTTTTHPSISSSSSQTPIDTSAFPPLPPGAQLHCIHVSSYVFKHGHITVPPRVALAASGFGEGDVGRRRWARVQSIRDTARYPLRTSSYSEHTGGDTTDTRTSASSSSSPPPWSGYTGLQALLRGGWRQYEEDEGLWDLTEFEEQRLAAIERFSRLRGEMEGLKGSRSHGQRTSVGERISLYKGHGALGTIVERRGERP